MTDHRQLVYAAICRDPQTTAQLDADLNEGVRHGCEPTPVAEICRALQRDGAIEFVEGKWRAVLRHPAVKPSQPSLFA